MNPQDYTVSPKLGRVKPPIGPASSLPYRVKGENVPKGTTRRRKTPSLLRGVIARNVAARARQVFPVSKNLPLEVRNASGTGSADRLTLSHVKRIFRAETSVSLEQLEGLAKALDLAAYQLLLPELDARNPQVVRGATHAEVDLYRKIAREEAEAVLSKTTPGLSPRPKK